MIPQRVEIWVCKRYRAVAVTYRACSQRLQVIVAAPCAFALLPFTVIIVEKWPMVHVDIDIHMGCMKVCLVVAAVFIIVLLQVIILCCGDFGFM
jgi:hypothetical protein